MHNKLTTLLFVLVLSVLLLPFVMSAPPAQTNVIGDSSWTVRTELVEAVEQSTDFELIAHIYNTSNGIPVTSDASCEFHVYDKTGHHIATGIDNTPSHDYDYEFRVNESNFTEVGEYAYVIQCNSSIQGGFIAGSFRVTPNGEIPTTATGIFYMGIFSVLLLFLVLNIWAITQFDNLIARFSLFQSLYLFVIAISFIAFMMASDFITSAPFLISMFEIIFWVVTIGFFPYVLVMMIWLGYSMITIKEINEMMERGISLDEAKARKGKTKW